VVHWTEFPIADRASHAEQSPRRVVRDGRTGNEGLPVQGRREGAIIPGACANPFRRGRSARIVRSTALR
jgi:hypothetical protein